MAFVSAVTPCGSAADGNNKNKLPRILFFSKSSGFEHDVVKRTSEGQSLSEAILTELGRTHGFDIVTTKDGSVFDGDLTQYEAFLFFTTGNLTEAGTDNTPSMSARGKEALLAAIRGGKGFLGVHSASDTFHSKGDRYEMQEQPDPYIAMLGGEFISHGRQQEARVKVVDPNFSGLRGSGESFTIKEEWYSLKNFSKDIHVLLVLETEGMHDSDYRRPPFPIAWARKEGMGRVYFNAMGHREDVWMSERFQQMLAGAVTWATGAEDAGVDANISRVTPEAGAMPQRTRVGASNPGSPQGWRPDHNLQRPVGRSHARVPQ
jgi:type 1 glutamine amidotransferase